MAPHRRLPTRPRLPKRKRNKSGRYRRNRRRAPEIISGALFLSVARIFAPCDAGHRSLIYAPATAGIEGRGESHLILHPPAAGSDPSRREGLASLLDRGKRVENIFDAGCVAIGTQRSDAAGNIQPIIGHTRTFSHPYRAEGFDEPTRRIIFRQHMNVEC